MDSHKTYGFDIFENWHCKFPIEKLCINTKPQDIMMFECRIEQLSKRLSLKGMRVLELGCLEGLHSFVLQTLGAREVIAIEGRQNNFLKCLVVKNAFNLDRCNFLLGDLNKILPTLSGHFDLCLAIGILYHLENPVDVIYRIAQLTDNIFIWTHCATEDYPKGQVSDISCRGNTYRGKYVGEDAGHYLSGLEKKSFWMFKDDIFKLTEDAGFRDIDLVGTEAHEHGPAITFLAKKPLAKKVRSNNALS